MILIKDMPINAGYEYINAEKEYLNAKTTSERIICLELMIKTAPKHKSSENLNSELKKRLKKFQEKEEKESKKGAGKKGIKKEGYQFVLIGKTNKGKSLLLTKLTNAFSFSSYYSFTTKYPIIGTFNFEDIKAQIIDMPSIGSEYFDIGLVNTADCLIIVIENFSEIVEMEKYLKRTIGKKIYVFNKSDLYDNIEKRKFESRIKSQKIKGFLISAQTGEGLYQLKKAMIEVMEVIRVYTKEPGKQPAKDPVVLKKGSIVKDVAECILKGFSLKVKETKVTGPSAKFTNQKVGLAHIVKDLDIVEFHTR